MVTNDWNTAADQRIDRSDSPTRINRIDHSHRCKIKCELLKACIAEALHGLQYFITLPILIGHACFVLVFPCCS